MSSPTATLIRNGRVITACDDYVADVLLQNGVVHTIGQAIDVDPQHLGGAIDADAADKAARFILFSSVASRKITQVHVP